MENNMTRIRWILLLIFIGGCAYFYRIGFYEQQQKHTIVIKTPVISTKRIPPKQYLDFAELARDLREYSSTQSDVLEQQLFPWWLHRRTDDNLKQSYSESDTSKGIVICTGNKHFQLTLVALKALELIGNELPIEVVFSTSNDLSSNNRQELEKLYPNIRLIDLSSASFNDSYLELRGWEIKPFSVLASHFREVILMDADVLFLEKPSTLFQNPYYLKTGSLFFYDRPSLSEDTIRWIRTLLSDNNNQSFPKRTQESGVVLIDKARALTGLLSTCKLNDHQEREKVTYQHLYGDKDTWWLGFHLIQMPYSFIPTLTASIGEIKDTGQNVVCGHILHLDENQRPIWWNGGMLRNRYISVKQLLTIDGWLYEGRWVIKAYSCLTNTGETAKKFSQDQQRLINDYRLITKKVFNIN
jgi:hypothetical protein